MVLLLLVVVVVGCCCRVGAIVFFFTLLLSFIFLFPIVNFFAINFPSYYSVVPRDKNINLSLSLFPTQPKRVPPALARCGGSSCQVNSIVLCSTVVASIFQKRKVCRINNRRTTYWNKVLRVKCRLLGMNPLL